ncbi:MAG TPA: hypothetical protein V6C71_26900 [Coleofasciculaceae cyanobacterium]|jgi:hypothetical protein
MGKQYRNKFNWRSLLGALAISLGAFSIIESSAAQATPELIQGSFELAQVGVRSQIDGPTPLNLRPRTHIPLPESRYDRRGYYGDREYRDHEYKYGHDHYHPHPRGDRHRRGTVIIINPSNYSESYRNSDNYIRVIRK